MKDETVLTIRSDHLSYNYYSCHEVIMSYNTQKEYIFYGKTNPKKYKQLSLMS